MPLPDVDEQSYNRYSADQFARNAQARIRQLGAEQPEVGELAHVPSVTQPGRLPFPMPQLPQPQLPGMPQLPWQQPQQQGPTTPPAAPQITAPTSFQPLPRLPGAGAPASAFAPSLGVSTPRQPVPEPLVDTGPPLAGPPRIPGIPGRMPQPAEPTWATPGAQPLGRTFQPPPDTGGDPLRTYAQQAAQRAGIDPGLFVAQIQQESGFNPRAGSPAGAQGIAQIMPQFHKVDTSDPYASLDYAANLMSSHLKTYGGDYAKALAAYNAGPGAVAKYGGVPPFEETQRYVRTILGGAPQPAAAPRTGAQQTAMAQSQFGDPELTADEAYAACGPAAAVRFAQAYGRNPTLREAVDLAKTVGWTPGQGMAGIVSEQQLLQKMGVETRLVPGAQWDQFAAEAQTGNPVTISTSAHYFLADGFNPQTGQFHVGRSGLDLRGGKEWMTADEIVGAAQRLGGGTVQGALFASNPTVTAPSTAAESPDFLNQQRQELRSSIMTQAPMPGVGATGGLRQLDQAVQQARQPAAELAHLPSAPVAKSDNPLEELGNTIGSAIQTALSAALGGLGGPPGGEDRRREAEDALARLRRNPFPEEGRRAEDIVGRTTGMYLEPPQDVREAVERAMTDVERRGVPSPGPGGALGILKPGKSLRELNPFSKGPEGSALDFAMGLADQVNPIRRVAGAVAPEAERLGGAAARSEGAILRSNVADLVTAAGEHLPAEKSAGAALSSRNPDSAWDWWVRRYSDQDVDLNHVQEDFQKLSGRRLRDDEMVAFLARVDPTHRALVATENAIGPALRSVPQEKWQTFQDLLDLRANISTAEGLAKKAEREYLKGGIAPRTEAELKEAMDDWMSIQDEVDEAESLRQQVQQGTIRTRESISLDAAQKRVDASKARLEAATEVARQTQAERAREEVMTAPGAKVVTQVEKRDLDIAENDLKRLERRYQTLFDRDPDDQYLDKLARQMGRLETRISRMRTDLGATSAAREERIIGRAEQAAEAAAARPTVTPTPEYAAARWRLYYEQKNLERLQAAQARGAKGLADDVARAKKRLDKAQADVEQATKDLPEAAKAQGWAQLEGRLFSGGRRYPELVEQLAKLRGGESFEDLALLEGAADKIFDFSRTLRDEMVDSGAWKREMADELDELYPDWLPTENLDYGAVDDTAGGMRVGQRLSMGDVMPRAYTKEGSEAEVEDRIMSQLRNADRTYRTAAKTRTVRALIASQANQPGGLKRIAPDVKTYEANKDTMHPPDYKPKTGKGERVITGWIDGEREQWVTDNPLIHAAVEKAPQGELSGIWNWFAKGADITREVSVSRNPLWLALNVARDLGTYLGVNTARGAARDPGSALGSGLLQGAPAVGTALATDDEDPYRGQKMAAALAAGIGARGAVGKHLGPNLLGEYFRALPDAFSGMGAGRYGGQGTQELLLGGGGMRGGGVFGGKTKDVEQSLNRLRPGSVPLTGMQELKNFVDRTAFGWVKTAGDRIELAPRVATMRVAQQRGESKLESVMRARDVTVDFDRGGSWVKATNRVIPFLNASVQGTTNIMRLAKDHPLAFMIAGSSLVGAPALYAEQHNHSTPELERDYEDVPDYVKRMGIVIMLGGQASVDRNGNRLPNYFVVPTSGFTPFVEAAREAYTRGTGRGGRNPLELAGTVAAELSPVQPTNPAEAAFGMASLPGASTAAQLFTNRDLFRNSMIATERTDENASALGKLLAEPLTDVVSRVPGLGAARIRPSQIDYTVRDLGGGLGTAALGLSDEVANRVAGTPLRSNAPSEIPVVGGPLGRFVRTTGGQRAAEEREAERMLTPSARRALRDAGIDWEPTPVTAEINDVRLRYEEQERVQRLTNRYVDDAVQKAMRTSGWARYDKPAREKLLDRVVSQAREKARDEVWYSIPLEERQARTRASKEKQ